MRQIPYVQTLILLLLAASLLAGCATSSQEVTDGHPTPIETPLQSAFTPGSFTDGMQRSIKLTDQPQRIISLAPANTEILFAIGAGPQVVGRDSFSDYPAEAAKIADVGGGFGELNPEVIVSLKPDLVLASALNAPEQIKALEDLGLTVFVVGNPSDLASMFDNLVLISQLSGHSNEAQKLVEQLKSRVAALDQLITNDIERPLVFYETDATDPNAPWTAGPGSFIDLMIARAGGKNIGSVLSNSWAQISLEELVAQNPDIILLGDSYWGGVTAEAVKARPGWEALSAVENGQIFPFDDNLISRPGPRMVDGYEALIRQLHPELFK